GAPSPDRAHTAPNRPEQFCVLALASENQLALGGHHIDREKIIDGEPVLAAQPTEAPTERETRHSGRRVDTDRGREPEPLGLAVELAQCDPRLDAGGPLDGVDADRLHRREIDHEAAIAHRITGNVVTAATNREPESVLPSDTNG